MRPNLMVTRRDSGLRIGMAVAMSDGWRGKIAEEGGGLVACLADGEKPDPHWCGDYRILASSSRAIAVKGNKIVVKWRSAAPRSNTDPKRQAARNAVVAGLMARALIEREWQDSPLN